MKSLSVFRKKKIETLFSPQFGDLLLRWVLCLLQCFSYGDVHTRTWRTFFKEVRELRVAQQAGEDWAEEGGMHIFKVVNSFLY